MSVPGASDPLYVAARCTLLDAIEGLGEQRTAAILVGAQAVYLHAGEADLAVAPYTTDGDLAIDPRRLASEPLLERAMLEAGFEQSASEVGIWRRHVSVAGVPRVVQVDLLVPATVGGDGRRGARIPPHAKTAARKVAGLEGALVDRDATTVAALDSRDRRSFPLLVAGPAALIVAKVHKIRDRVADAERRSDKDALDVYRLLRAVSTDDLVERFARLRTQDVSRAAAHTAVVGFRDLFATARAEGTQMARRAAEPLEDGATLVASLVALANDLLERL